jgi:hypothetical protein
MTNEYVFEIQVAPIDGTTGTNLIKVLNLLEVRSSMALLFVVDVECNGNRAWVQRPPFQTTVDEIYMYAESVGQFDWASLFFFKSPSDEPNDTVNYAGLFTKAALVVRAVDDTFFLVYSPKAEDAERLSHFFPVQCERTRRDEITHPT